MQLLVDVSDALPDVFKFDIARLPLIWSCFT